MHLMSFQLAKAIQREKLEYPETLRLARQSQKKSTPHQQDIRSFAKKVKRSFKPRTV